MGKYFGTDGIRGVANKELDVPLAYKVGRAAAAVLAKETAGKPLFTIGKDTRISGDMLEAALVSGLCSAGGNVIPVPDRNIVDLHANCHGIRHDGSEHKALKPVFRHKLPYIPS